MITDWDDAYANRAHVPGVDAILARWEVDAPAARKAHASEALSTGPGPRQFLDLYRPEQASQGLTIFVHGGYWMAFEGRDFAHLVRGPLARGHSVASVTYSLAPDARISAITAELQAAVQVAAEAVAGPIRLIGHSAGGHLVTRMMCDGMLPGAVADRVVQVVTLSGVHDLRPLLRTTMNETLRLTPEEAAAESPALRIPVAGTRLTCVVGADERPEFRRQSALLANVWTGLGAETRLIEMPGENHFSIIDGLERPDTDLMRLVFD